MTQAIASRVFSRVKPRGGGFHSDYDYPRPTRRTWEPRNSRRQQPYRPLQQQPRQRPRLAETRPPERRELAIPPAYFELTREHFAIVKTIHHLNVLKSGLPASLRKKASFLSDSVRPAFRNEAFVTTMETITDSWNNQVKQALVTHYIAVLNDAKDRLATWPMPHELLEKSIRVVTSWSRRQLGLKLQDDELDEALQLIRSTQCVTAEDPDAPLRSQSPGLPSTTSDQATQTSWPTPWSNPRVTGSTPCIQVPEPTTLPAAPVESPTLVVMPARTEDSKPAPSMTEPLPVSVDLDESFDLVPETVDEATTLSVATQDVESITPPSILHSEPPATPPTDEPEWIVQPATDGAAEATPGMLNSLGAVSEPFHNIKNVVVCGDRNISSFTYDSITTITDNSGRMNFFRGLFKRYKDFSFPNVLTFVFCLSLLDRQNLPATNFNYLRTILYSIRRMFPSASLHVLLCGEPQLDTQVANITAFNDMVRERRPANCEVIEPPQPFLSNDSVWERSTRESVFSTLRSTLNL